MKKETSWSKAVCLCQAGPSEHSQMNILERKSLSVWRESDLMQNAWFQHSPQPNSMSLLLYLQQNILVKFLNKINQNKTKNIEDPNPPPKKRKNHSLQFVLRNKFLLFISGRNQCNPSLRENLFWSKINTLSLAKQQAKTVLQ